MDVLSDDGRHAITIIGLLGSVFSPFYAKARARGSANPLAHCSMNVALYGPHGGAWAFTERGEREVRREASSLSIGPSSMEWNGSSLCVHFDELTAPFPRRLTGVVRVHPEFLVDHAVGLDTRGRHRWAPLAPASRAEIEITHPESVRFSGTAYLDTNWGDEPLEDAFVGWNWSRAGHGRKATVTYHADRLDGSQLRLAKQFQADGSVHDVPALASHRLPRTLWGLERTIAADSGARPQLARTLEDTPFYARSVAHARFRGEHTQVIHEALSLERFRSRWVKFMLPYRMRRTKA